MSVVFKKWPQILLQTVCISGHNSAMMEDDCLGGAVGSESHFKDMAALEVSV